MGHIRILYLFVLVSMLITSQIMADEEPKDWKGNLPTHTEYELENREAVLPLLLTVGQWTVILTYEYNESFINISEIDQTVTSICIELKMYREIEGIMVTYNDETEEEIEAREWELRKLLEDEGITKIECDLTDLSLTYNEPVDFIKLRFDPKDVYRGIYNLNVYYKTQRISHLYKLWVKVYFTLSNGDTKITENIIFPLWSEWDEKEVKKVSQNDYEKLERKVDTLAEKIAHLEEQNELLEERLEERIKYNNEQINYLTFTSLLVLSIVVLLIYRVRRFK